MRNRVRGPAVEGGQDLDEENNWKRKWIIIRYGWENMLEILPGEASKGHKKKKNRDRKI